MKTTIITLLLLISAMFMVGCEDDQPEILIVDEIPLPPQGVTTVTGDGEVTVYWYGVYEEDITGYIVYRSLVDSSGYESIGLVSADPNSTTELTPHYFVDDEVDNGTTYFYAVATVDDAGQESIDLSYEIIFDTPRPEGTATLFDTASVPTVSALLFGEPSIPVAYTTAAADFFIDAFEGRLYINAKDIDTDIQDMGYTEFFEEIGYAPHADIGWSTLGYFELLIGHTYVFWTRDDHYAKVRVTSLSATSVQFEWAFQTDQQNPELAPSNFSDKPRHSANYLNKRSPIVSNNQ